MKKIITKCTQLIAFVVLTAVLLSGCTTQKPVVDPKDLSYLYNPLKNTLYPRFSVLNETDDRAVLSVKFLSNELFFSQANPAGIPMAMMFMSVRLYNTSAGRTLADTAFYDIDIIQDSLKNEHIYRISLSVEKGMDYIADVKVIDKVRQSAVQSFYPFNTKSESNRYNFFIRGHSSKKEVMQPIIKRNEYFNIVYTRGMPDSIFISVYQPYNEFPYPPSMVLPEKPGPTEPDTVIALPYSPDMPLMFPNEGVYFCTTSRDAQDGFSILNFGNDYPAMKNPAEMTEPLAYLASPDELAALKSSARQKVALDDFWIRSGGNVEKARELIRIYYTRVVYANYYFTSHKEGWRTDRGMIYVIYGPPDKLYKSNEEENWGYKRPVINSRWGNRYQVKEDYLFFSFKRRESKFSGNEYSLSRSETVITNWDKAVLTWRKGQVFRLDDPLEY